MTPLLEVSQLDAGYGRLAVLRDVSIRVDAGELVAVLGPNGAGKSTLLRAISHLEADRTGGSVRFDGRELARERPEQIARLGLAHVPEGRQLFTELSVEDNIRLGAFGRPRSQVEAALSAAYERFPQLEKRKTSTAFALSGGEQQMLAIARALAAAPKLLMLDEPSTGLAPQIVRAIFDIIAGLRERGTAVLLVEQNAFLTLQRADRAYVLEHGTIALAGTAAELSRDARVREIYLGGSTEDEPAGA
ncbi:MAG: ABC transporter ATP-binding protein [Candidatus Eremiobacteraeota bacterium]|nr:ABC transporter ATP-binding protein [Candidatus Eremiobacteraeota bacterium]